ncbi:MAG TPA: hypothetical protein VF945_03485, partial [Polyangia bacterium]
MELVEHLARIALVARQLGGVRPLPSALLPKLLEARAKAGLGGASPSPSLSASAPSPGAPSAGAPSPSGKKVVVACAPPPPGSDVEVYDPKRTARATVLPSPTELAAIIRQEIAAALKK